MYNIYPKYLFDPSVIKRCRTSSGVEIHFIESQSVFSIFFKIFETSSVLVRYCFRDNSQKTIAILLSQPCNFVKNYWSLFMITDPLDN